MTSRAFALSWMGNDRIANPPVIQSGDQTTPIMSGHPLSLGPLELHPGGANLGAILDAFGLPTTIVGVVAEADGGGILRSMAAAGLSTKGVHISTKAASSGYNVAFGLRGDDRYCLYDVGANAELNWNLVPEDVLLGSDICIISMAQWTGLWRNGGQELLRCLQEARKRKLFTVLDLAFPGDASVEAAEDGKLILQLALPYVDLFAPSFKELLYLWDRNQYWGLCQRVAGTGRGIVDFVDLSLVETMASLSLDCGAGAALIRAGSRGMLFQCRQAVWPTADAEEFLIPVWQRPFRALGRVKNTLGVGDVAVGTFLAAFSHGCTILESLRVASLAAAESLVVINPLAYAAANSFAEVRRRAAAASISSISQSTSRGPAAVSGGSRKATCRNR